MISNCISDDIPPQMKILNMVIPILMHFCSFVSNRSIASPMKLHVTQQNVTQLIKLFSTVYQRIYCCKYLTLSKQMSRYKIKYIRILYYPLLSRSLQFYSLIMKVFFYIKQFIGTCHLPDVMCRI